MQIIDLNSCGGIGANAHYLRLGSFRVLIDCGLHPKKLGKDAMPDLAPVEEGGLDLIVLTHCHLDHLGALPLAAALFPDVPIATSGPNLSLAPRMLRNSVNVMKRQRQDNGRSDVPLYLHRDVAAAARQFEGQRFGRTETYLKNGDALDVTLHCAGHVPGAAAVEFVHNDRRALFSGDVLFEAQRTLPGATLPEGPIDTLVLETTRGATERPPETTRWSETARLFETVARILERGGSCLLPVFALGRMQEIFKLVHEARGRGALPHSPIHTAGLGLDIAAHFESIRKKTGLIDFDMRILEDMKVRPPAPNLVAGRDLPHRGLYILSSGMLVERTPAYNAAASALPHSKNGICIVGYCDPDSPGGKLLDAVDHEATDFFFDAHDYLAPMRASVDRFDLSGHADREELADYARTVGAQRVVLAHGDPEAREWFVDALPRRLPNAAILNPRPGVAYDL